MSYRKGFEDGLRCYSFEFFGIECIEAGGVITLEQAIAQAECHSEFNPPPAPESYPLDDLAQLVKDALDDATECDDWMRDQVAEHFLHHLREVLEGRGLVMGGVTES